MPKKADQPDAIIDAAMELAALEGWRHVTLGDIARHAKVSLADLYGHYPSKSAILAGFLRRADQAMLTGIDPEEMDESPRERLFDVIMRRFDALRPHREAVRAVLRDSVRDPVSALCLAAGPMQRTLDWMLEASGIDSGGMRGAIRRKGLGVIYLSVLRVWLDDDSEDMARTMAALDRQLKRAESLIQSVPGARRRSGAAGGEAGPTAEAAT